MDKLKNPAEQMFAILGLLLVLTWMAPAVAYGLDQDAGDCRGCIEMQKLTAQLQASKMPQSELIVDRINHFLERFMLSEQTEIRQKEISYIVKLVAVTLPLDAHFRSPQALLNFYSEYPAEFRQALAQLPAQDRQRLQKAMADAQKLFDEGNG